MDKSHPRRVFRVYSREGILQSVSEPMEGLEHVLSRRYENVCMPQISGGPETQIRNE
jgi:hypothetical protein